MSLPASGWTLWHSSCVIAGQYDAATRTLWLRFGDNKTGKVKKVTHYRYAGVPPEVWAGLQEADSKGTAFRATVLGRFDHAGPF